MTDAEKPYCHRVVEAEAMEPSTSNEDDATHNKSENKLIWPWEEAVNLNQIS